MFDLTGRKALVTGASGAIGGAIASALAARGARVALSGTRADALEALAAGLPGSLVLPRRLDDAGAVDALVPDAVAALGGLDILVNNAGITRDNLAMRMKDEEWEAVIRVNLEAAFRLARAALRPMMKARFGRILSITSVVGVTGNPGQANYAASKAGVAAFTKSLAKAAGPDGITVNCVNPGVVDTPMTRAWPAAWLQEFIAQTPLGRLGTPEDVAGAIVFLASSAGSFITGAQIDVNGGLHMA